MDKSTLQRTFRNEVNCKIDVEHIGGERYAIFIPCELEGERELRIVLWRDTGGRWWLTDECRTFRHQPKMGTTVLYGIEIRLEVLEDVSGGDLKLFISALVSIIRGMERLSYENNQSQRFIRKGTWI